MKTIYKYPIPIKVPFPLRLPKGAKILSIQTQGIQPCMWIEVKIEDKVELTKYEERWFFTIGTGQQLPDTEIRYIETYQDGPFVWHVYEQRKEHYTIMD
jgi:hypothetical protein